MSRNSVTSKFVTALADTSWTMLSVIGGAPLLLGLLLAPIYLESAGMEFLETSVGTVVLYALQYVLALFVLMVVPFIQARGQWRLLIPQLGVNRRPKFKDALYAIPAWAVYFASTILVLTVVSMLLPGLDLEQSQEVGFDGISLPYEYVLAFVALAILPPLAEEMIFRGYLFGRLRKNFSFWPATIVTSLAFGIVHMQLNVGIDVFVLSIYLCYLREKTGSIWASVFLHSIKNSIAYVFLFVIK